MICKLLLFVFIAPCAFSASIGVGQERAASSQSFDQLLQSAETARNENRDSEAIQLFRRALSMQPESEQALWYLGTMLYEKEQYVEARDVLRHFVAVRSDAGPAWALLGLSEFQLRAYPHALDHLQRAMVQGMGDRSELIQTVFYDVTILLCRFERYDDSMDMILKMLASGPPDAMLVEPAGLAGLRLPLMPAEMAPGRRELVDLAGHAVLAMQTRHLEEAESAFKQLVAAYPDEPGVHFLYGAYLAQIDPGKAVPEFERELEISPLHVLARVRLAEQLIAQGDFDRALTLTQQAINLEPKRASAHMLAGEALIGKGNAADGIKELEIARADNPAVNRTHWDLLRSYAAAGRKEDADREKQEIEKLSQANSSSPPNATGDVSRDRVAPR